jgi:hypothetical protein
MYDECPPHLSPPPIQIYHPILTKFISRANSEFDGDEETLRLTSEFIQVSREFYSDKRRWWALRHLPGVLIHPHILSSQKVYIGPEGHWILPSGVVWVDSKPIPIYSEHPICAFSEVEDEIGNGGWDPALHCQSDYVQVHSSDKVSALSKPQLLVY